jgi:hypothetical protein
VRRAAHAERGPDLEPWNTYGPHEPARRELSTLIWDGYVAAESRVFEEVRDQVTRQLEPDRFAGLLGIPDLFPGLHQGGVAERAPRVRA